MCEQYYKNICIVNEMSRVSHCVNRQDYVSVINTISSLMKQLSEALPRILEMGAYLEGGGLQVSEAYVTGMLMQLLEAQQAEDYVLYNDLLQLQVMPFFIEVQNVIRSQEGFFFDEGLFEKNMERLRDKDGQLYERLRKAEHIHNASDYSDCIYKVEFTTVGAFTLALEEQGKTYYLHSNNNPYIEAQEFAQVYYDMKQEHYVGFGLGLGYQWQALASCNPDINLVICEPDIGILELAFTYMDMDWYLFNDNIQICYDPDFEMLNACIAKNDGHSFVILRPYIRHIRYENVRRLLEECMVRENSIYLYQNAFYLNSKSNFEACDGYVDELYDAFCGKRVVLIAGGPSLDKNVSLLKNKPENTIYVAVGTVFRKLLALDIRPDYVVISDPKKDVYIQVKDLEQETIPMLLLSTAYRKIGRNYQGKKYLICQKGYNDAEQFAKLHGRRLYHVGGSVITIALDVAIALKAEEIICIGLDLAFTDNRDHASDVRQHKEIIAEGNFTVPAVGGGTVKTNRPFHMYQKWIENRLRESDVVMPVWDATEGGALIAGMKIALLSELI